MQQPAAVDRGWRRGGKWWSLSWAWGLWWGWTGLLSPEMPLPPAGQCNPESKTQVSSGMFTPERAHAFLSWCVYVYVSFACSAGELSTLSWRVVVHKKTSQEANRQQRLPRRKHHLQHKKKQAPPTHLFPHPPHQWEARWPSTVLCPSASPNTQASGKENSRLHRKEGKLPVLAPQELQPQSFPSSFCKKMRKRSSILPWQISSQAVLMSQISHAR